VAIVYPDVEEVEGAVADLLREVEYRSLAVVGPTPRAGRFDDALRRRRSGCLLSHLHLHP
jgi:hypothetical protein